MLDGVDGETARLHFSASRRGAALDGLVDRLVDGAVLASLGKWILEDSFRPRTLLLLLVIAGAWAVVTVPASRLPLITYRLPRQT